MYQKSLYSKDDGERKNIFCTKNFFCNSNVSRLQYECRKLSGLSDFVGNSMTRWLELMEQRWDACQRSIFCFVATINTIDQHKIRLMEISIKYWSLWSVWLRIVNLYFNDTMANLKRMSQNKLKNFFSFFFLNTSKLEDHESKIMFDTISEMTNMFDEPLLWWYTRNVHMGIPRKVHYWDSF